MTNKIDTESVKQSIDLRAFAERYTTLRKKTATESAGPCPWCFGDDRFLVFADHYFCRQCKRTGDIYTLVMECEHLNFNQAKAFITGNAMPATFAPVKPSGTGHQAQPSEWDEGAMLELAMDAHNVLMDGPGHLARQARDYLLSRGVELATARAFKLGCHGAKLPLSDQREIAILFPWLDKMGVMKAARYRFLRSHEYTDKNGTERAENKTSAYGSSFAGAVFGWQAVKGPKRNSVLFLVEGEFNALSIWQAGGGLIDVVSVGSESALTNLPDDLVTFAQQYRWRIVWADKSKFADPAAKKLGAQWSQRSPSGRDANDALIAGTLGRLLPAILKQIGATLPSPKATIKPPLPPELWQTDLDQRTSWLLFNDLRDTYLVARGTDKEGNYYLLPPKEYRDERTTTGNT